jgi:hypothetical protein
MFKELGNFALERTGLQAFGFYLAYLALTMVIAMIFGFAVGMLMQSTEDISQLGVGIGAVIAAIVSATLSYMVLKAKNRLGNFSSIVLIVLAAGLGLLAGLLGMIVPAVLTTKDMAGSPSTLPTR